MAWKKGGLTKCGQRRPGCPDREHRGPEGWQDYVVSRVIGQSIEGTIMENLEFWTQGG